MRIERSNRTGRLVEIPLFSAHTSACICSPYISEFYAQKIITLAKKGVALRVLTTDKFIGPQFFIRQFFKEEKERGALNSFYFIVRRYTETMEHSKIFVIDDLSAVFGSANLTDPGMWKQYETVSVSETIEEVQAIKAAFDMAWQEALISH